MSKRRTRSSTVRDEILDDESQMDPDYTPESGSGLSQSSGTTEEDVIEIGSDENSDRRAIADSEVDVDEFIRGAKSKNTLASDNYFLKLYKDTMKSVAMNNGHGDYPGLLETRYEDLPKYLEKFFMVCVKRDGTIFNASTIEQYYQVLLQQTFHFFILVSSLNYLKN